MMRNRTKSKENDHFRKARNPKQSNSVDRFAKSGQLDLLEAQYCDARPWHRSGSFWETKPEFPFSTWQTLENLSKCILLSWLFKDVHNSPLA